MLIRPDADPLRPALDHPAFRAGDPRHAPGEGQGPRLDGVLGHDTRALTVLSQMLRGA